MGNTVQLKIRDRRLADALGERLWRSGFVVEPGRPGAGAAVVVIASETTPAACGELVAGGSPVIVLAALATRADADCYLAAGAAAYLPMMLDSSSLVEALTSAFGELPPVLPATRSGSGVREDGRK